LEEVVNGFLDHDNTQFALGVFREKKYGLLGSDGLERGVPALKVITKHLESEGEWPFYGGATQVGKLCQIVDDVLDYRKDMDEGGLNCLASKSASVYLRKLVEWDHQLEFRKSRYPKILFLVINFGKFRARRMLLKREGGDVGQGSNTRRLQL